MSEVGKPPPEFGHLGEEASLGIGESDFETLIDAGSVYVDKTKIIHSLLTRKYRRYFLTRPRRFGKSLLLSTIEDIFHGKKELFDNMYISGPEAKYNWPKCHVIRLDMSSFGNNPLKFDANLTRELKDIAEIHGVRLNRSESGPGVVKLIKTLFRSFRDIPIVINEEVTNVLPDERKVVVLIDEYDFPLITNHNRAERFQAIREQLYQFYAQLKSILKYVGFLFITGITKFSVLTSSSGLNSVRDISFEPEFSTICGFTREDINKHFMALLTSAHGDLMGKNVFSRLSKPANVLDMLMEWYDGYTWDGKTNVLNPESILNFFLKKDFGRYWYDTGGPNFLEQLQLKDEKFFDMFAKNVSYKGSINLVDIGTLTPLTSLLQTGYLTIRKPSDPEDAQKSNMFDLVIPNKEVRLSYAEDFLIGRLYPDIDSEARENLISRYKGFCRAISAIRPREASEQLTSIYANFSHVHHPDKAMRDREFFYKSHMLPALYYLDAVVTAEKREAGGDPDFVIEMHRGGVFILEVKYSKLPDSADEVTDGISLKPPDSTVDDTMGINGHDSDGDYADDQGQKSDASTFGAGLGSGIQGANCQEPKKDPKTAEINKLLDGGIRRAFKQIHERQYAEKYLGGKHAVYAVAISIAGRFHVRIKFKRLDAVAVRG
jgi:hypothetical protein